ncbi:MAG: UDP-glucose 4-epimerase GalE [Candidatus Saccharimonadales bacterium]
MNILVTGGTGYIGSHTIIELINDNHTVVVIDNLINSSAESLKRVETITGKHIPFHRADLCDIEALDTVFNQYKFDAVIHFAGLKAVSESVKNPLLYYETNIDATLNLLKTMNHYGVKQLVFSSSATVYGSAPIPYVESYPAGRDITSPYGKTKYIIEEILSDLYSSDNSLSYTALRYFNPIGAHKSGDIGEDPSGIPNNLMPFISQVASGKRDKLSIFGNDYDTPDGTCIRDYIHVTDVARGHVAALKNTQPGFHTYNLGSGKGTSVLELVAAFEKATGQKIPYVFAPRRSGDLPEFFADASKAKRDLGWQTTLSIEDACRDNWRWQSQNPSGFGQ